MNKQISALLNVLQCMFPAECKVCAEPVMDKGTLVRRVGWGLLGFSLDFYRT